MTVTETIDDATRLVRVEGMMSTRLDDEIVILNLATNNYVALDEVGRRIWELLEEPMRTGELCRRLAEEFSGDTEQIRSDVADFLGELSREGMVRLAD